MSLIDDRLKEVLPPIKDAFKNGLQALRNTRRKRQHSFVLKAITRRSRDHGLSVPPTEGRRYDLAAIDGKLYTAHLEAAVACYRNEDMEAAIGSYQNKESELPLLAVEREGYRKELKAVQKRYGLPKLHDPKRAAKIEAILHDMDDKLRFHPPNSWSIK